MNIRKAVISGLNRVNQVKKFIILVYFLNLILAIILGAQLIDAIQQSLPQSMAAENLRLGFDDLWYRSFSANAVGLARTFRPTVVGIGAVLDGLDAFLSGKLFNSYAGIICIGLVYMILWTFLTPGFIAKFQRSEANDLSFFQACGKFFFRFVNLAIMAGILYFLIFQLAMNGFGKWINNLTRNVIDERAVFVYTLLKYLIVWTLVFAVNLVFDYSKIMTVTQNLRVVITAPIRALRFIFSCPVKTAGLYLSLTMLWILFLLFYWWVAPGVGQTTWIGAVGAFFLGQIYLLLRIGLRCLYYGSQVALYEELNR